MKTSVIAWAGLGLAVVLALPAMGCRINHYGASAAAVDRGDDLRCKVTCERLIEDGAIPRRAARACQSACQSSDPAGPSKTARTTAPDSPCAQTEE
jgi:hypothetical protein